MGREAAAKIDAALRAGPLNLKDRFGRPVAEGNSYTYMPALPQVYQVERITPVLDRPDLPAGMFRVEMTSRAVLIMANGGRADEIALCYLRVAEPTPPPAPPTESPDHPTDQPQPTANSEAPDGQD